MPAGRPSTYTPKIVAAICARIADGEPLSQICRDETMPASSTVYLWLTQHAEFSERYARAREAMMEHFADQILEIAEDGRNDWEERENARTGSTYVALNSEAIARSNMRIEARKWLMGKCAPKKYGDRVTQTIEGAVDLNHRNVPDPELDKRISELEAKLKG